MDGSFRRPALADTESALEDVVAQGGSFSELRLRVQEWVQKNAAFPCRTEPTTAGVWVHYTILVGGVHVYKHCLVGLEHPLLDEYCREYAQCGW